MVSPAALARLGIATPGPLRARVSGVTGSSAADLVRVGSVAVGNATVGPLVLVAHDARLLQADGLLGRHVLGAFTVTIDAGVGPSPPRRSRPAGGAAVPRCRACPWC